MAIPDGAPPFLYSEPERSRSVEEAAVSSPGGREVNIAKSALQWYIQTWMTPGHANHKLLIAHQPRSAIFVSSIADKTHFDMQHSWTYDDPTARSTQVARFCEEFRDRTPMILIMDGGFQNRVAGIGDVQGARRLGNTGVYEYILVSDLLIQLEIMVIAGDESTAGDLAYFLSSVLGAPLRRFGGGNLITSASPVHISGIEGYPGSWEMKLPHGTLDVGTISRESIGDDPKSSRWATSLPLPVTLESVRTIQSSIGITAGPQVSIVAAGDQLKEFSSSDLDTNLVISWSGPSSVSVRHGAEYRIRTPVSAIAIPQGLFISVTDPAIGTISMGSYRSSVYFLPRKIGTTALRLIRRSDQKIIASIDITVTPR